MFVFSVGRNGRCIVTSEHRPVQAAPAWRRGCISEIRMMAIDGVYKPEIIEARLTRQEQKIYEGRLFIDWSYWKMHGIFSARRWGQCPHPSWKPEKRTCVVCTYTRRPRREEEDTGVVIQLQGGWGELIGVKMPAIRSANCTWCQMPTNTTGQGGGLDVDIGQRWGK